MYLIRVIQGKVHHFSVHQFLVRLIQLETNAILKIRDLYEYNYVSLTSNSTISALHEEHFKEAI